MSDLTGTTSSACTVLLAGAPLDPLVAMYIDTVEVDSTLFVPSQFKITFRNEPEETLITGGFQLAVPVIITASEDGVPTPLITGEITSVEVETDATGVWTVVRGMDRSNRLMRGRKTMAYPEMMASTVVTMLCGEASVIPGEIIPTSTLYPVLTQANQSSWEFIQQLARLENYIAYTSPEGMFNFKPWPTPLGAPPALTYDTPPISGQLVMGRNVRRMRAVVNSAEQTEAVTVTGYDPDLAIPVIAPSPLLPSTSILLDPATESAAVAGEFAATPYFDATRPFDDEGAAMTYAKTLADDFAAALAEIEAECDGNPSITAGSVVSLGMSGPPFEGTYVVSAARHVFDPSRVGYSTWVTVGGRRDRSTLALTSSGPERWETGPIISGIVTAKVILNSDPENKGRVKLMFPWLDPTYISDWARVMCIGATVTGGGMQWYPNVNDEVLVAFDRGCIAYPYVIGGVYNGINQPQPGSMGVPPIWTKRNLVSSLGHQLIFDDSPESPGVTLGSAPLEEPLMSMKFDSQQTTITVDSKGMINITGIGPVTISSDATMTITAPELTIGDDKCVNLTIGGKVVSMGSEAGTISVGGGASVVNVSGSMINLGG